MLRTATICGLTILVLAQSPAAAQESPSGEALRLQLNQVKDIEAQEANATGPACQAYFALYNETPRELSNLTVDTYFLDGTDGVLQRLLLGFTEVPPGSRRFFSFTIPATDCSTIASVLVNEITACSYAGGDAGQPCVEILAVDSRIADDVAVEDAAPRRPRTSAATAPAGQ